MTGAEFDLITFDCYGTLIDWESGITAAFRNEVPGTAVLDQAEIIGAYAREEAAVEAEDYRPYKEVLAETVARVTGRLGLELSPGRSDFLANSMREWAPFHDTNPALERLGRHFRLGIISNVDDRLLAQTLEMFTVKFDLIVTAEQVKSYKPAHGHFEEARARSNGARILHAAQSYYHDVVPASTLGIPVVWVNRKRECLDPAGLKPTHEVGDLKGLADWLGV